MKKRVTMWLSEEIEEKFQAIGREQLRLAALRHPTPAQVKRERQCWETYRAYLKRRARAEEAR